MKLEHQKKNHYNIVISLQLIKINEKKRNFLQTIESQHVDNNDPREENHTKRTGEVFEN